jgi:hypothetical protein
MSRELITNFEPALNKTLRNPEFPSRLALCRGKSIRDGYGASKAQILSFPSMFASLAQTGIWRVHNTGRNQRQRIPSTIFLSHWWYRHGQVEAAKAPEGKGNMPNGKSRSNARFRTIF